MRHGRARSSAVPWRYSVSIQTQTTSAPGTPIRSGPRRASSRSRSQTERLGPADRIRWHYPYVEKVRTRDTPRWQRTHHLSSHQATTSSHPCRPPPGGAAPDQTQIHRLVSVDSAVELRATEDGSVRILAGEDAPHRWSEWVVRRAGRPPGRETARGRAVPSLPSNLIRPGRSTSARTNFGDNGYLAQARRLTSPKAGPKLADNDQGKAIRPARRRTHLGPVLTDEARFGLLSGTGGIFSCGMPGTRCGGLQQPPVPFRPLQYPHSPGD